MRREIHSWWSPSLNKEMEIVMYGHYGYALLMFPTAGADFLEYERFQMIDSIAPHINSGKIKVFSINSINKESWLNDWMNPYDKAIRHQQYNDYITNEVVPFIHAHTSSKTPIMLTGASVGALHSANNLFRRPDLFQGVIAMSGVYDLKEYTKGYFDSNVYFNSPTDYLPRWEDDHILGMLRRKTIIIASGRGEFESPSAAINLSNILHSKGVEHWLDIWGDDKRHDWPTWRDMLPYFIDKINL
jgi:esterase/lipase superfamily enzyme